MPPALPLLGQTRRGRLIRATRAYLANNGYREATLAEFAAAIKVSEAELVEEFRSAEQLILSALALTDASAVDQHFGGENGRGWVGLEGWARMTAQLAALPDALALYLRIRVASIDPAHPAYDWIAAQRELGDRVIRRAVETGQADGTISAELDVAWLSRAIMAYFEGLQLRSFDPTQSFSFETDFMMFFDALRARYELVPPAGD